MECVNSKCPRKPLQVRHLAASLQLFELDLQNEQGAFNRDNLLDSIEKLSFASTVRTHEGLNKGIVIYELIIRNQATDFLVTFSIVHPIVL